MRFVGAWLAAMLIGATWNGAAADDAPAGLARYRFLDDSIWYVPTATLPAVLLDLETGAASPVLDQTVWEITDYRYGYFLGRTVAQFRDPDTGRPIAPAACMRLLGSVTPSGDVHLTFVDQEARSALGAVRGTGELKRSRDGAWRFTMQMSSGTGALVAHWSYMDECRSGGACRSRLPGTRLSLSEFLALCEE